MVLDNFGCHKSQEVCRWWIRHHDRILPLWLPAYTPDLNPIARLAPL